MRSDPASTVLRIVQIAPSVPYSSVPHAGGRYQLRVVEAQQDSGAEVALLVPSLPASRRELPLAPPGLLALDPERGLPHSPLVSLVLRASHRTLSLVARTSFPWIHPPFVAALALTPRVRRLLRSADVIDLQWYEMICLAPLIRTLAGPRPRLVGTFHDVKSQRLERLSHFEADPAKARRFRRESARHRRWEGWFARWLDRCLVLSTKDADLLTASGVPSRKVRVIDPPIQLPPEPEQAQRRQRHSRKVLVVGYLMRHENIDAATRVITEMWPRVLDAVPDAELHIIGAEAPSHLVRLASTTPRVHLRGFVDDLWAEYLTAGCNVVALRDGAGVKFKTIESIVAGVPTVATPIGAEGVADASAFVTISEDPAELTRGIITALTDPASTERAESAAYLLRHRHGAQSFADAIGEVYSSPSASSSHTESAPSPGRLPSQRKRSPR